MESDGRSAHRRRWQHKRKPSRSASRGSRVSDRGSRASDRGSRASDRGILASLSSLAGYGAFPEGSFSPQQRERPPWSVTSAVAPGAAAATGNTARTKRRPRKKRVGNNTRENGPPGECPNDIRRKFKPWVPASGAQKGDKAAGDRSEKMNGNAEKSTAAGGGKTHNNSENGVKNSTGTPGKADSSIVLSRSAKQRQRKKLKRMQSSQSNGATVDSGKKGATEAGPGAGSVRERRPSVSSAVVVPNRGANSGAAGDKSGTAVEKNGESSRVRASKVRKFAKWRERREQKRREFKASKNQQSGQDNVIVVKLQDDVSAKLECGKAEEKKPNTAADGSQRKTGTGAETTVDGSTPKPAADMPPPITAAGRRSRKRRRPRMDSTAESASGADGAAPEQNPTDRPANSSANVSTNGSAETAPHPGQTHRAKRRPNRKRQRLAARFDNLPPPGDGDGGVWTVVDSVACDSGSASPAPDSPVVKGKTGAAGSVATVSRTVAGTDAGAADSSDSKVGATAGAKNISGTGAATGTVDKSAGTVATAGTGTSAVDAVSNSAIDAKASSGAVDGVDAGAADGSGVGAGAKRRGRKRRRRVSSQTNGESQPPAAQTTENSSEKTAQTATKPSADTAKSRPATGPQARSQPSGPATTERTAKKKPRRAKRRKGPMIAGPEKDGEVVVKDETPETGDKTAKSAGADGPNSKSNEEAGRRSASPENTPPIATLLAGGDSDDGDENEKDRRWWWKNRENSGEGEGGEKEKPISARAKWRRNMRRRAKEAKAVAKDSAAEPKTETGPTGADSTEPTPAKVARGADPSQPSASAADASAQTQAESAKTAEQPAQGTDSVVTKLSAAERKKTKHIEWMRQRRQHRRQAAKDRAAAKTTAAAEAEKANGATEEPRAAASTAVGADSTTKGVAEPAEKLDVDKASMTAATRSAAAALSSIAADASAKSSNPSTTPATVATVTTGAVGPADSGAKTATTPGAENSTTTTTGTASTAATAATATTADNSGIESGVDSAAAESGAETAAAGPGVTTRRRQRRRRGQAVSQPGRLLMGGTINDPLNLAGLESPDSPRTRSKRLAIAPPAAASETNTASAGPAKGPVGSKSGKEVADISKAATAAGPEAATESTDTKPAQTAETSTLAETSVTAGSSPRSDSSAGPPDTTTTTTAAAASATGIGSEPELDPRKAQFRYGNYNRYYGYRNSGGADARLACLRPEWFSGKDVLDVGCNIGHVTLTLARDHLPRRCVGLDIDASLIKIARKNIKHYVPKPAKAAAPAAAAGDAEKATQPQSPAPTAAAVAASVFPRNVTFVHANFVLESDALLDTVKPEFDTVLCLSITKWVHLNFGDAGLRRFLCRVYKCLRPGGRLILEPQPWSSYQKYKKLTPTIADTFTGLQLRPDQFPGLLEELGFLPAQPLGQPTHAASGFSRQLQMFVKPGGSEQSPEDDTATVVASTAPSTNGCESSTEPAADSDAASAAEVTETLTAEASTAEVAKASASEKAEASTIEVKETSATLEEVETAEREARAAAEAKEALAAAEAVLIAVSPEKAARVTTTANAVPTESPAGPKEKISQVTTAAAAVSAEAKATVGSEEKATEMATTAAARESSPPKDSAVVVDVVQGTASYRASGEGDAKAVE